MAYCNGDGCECRDFYPGEKTYYFEQEEGSLYCASCAGKIERKYPGYIAKSADDIKDFDFEDDNEAEDED